MLSGGAATLTYSGPVGQLLYIVTDTTADMLVTTDTTAAMYITPDTTADMLITTDTTGGV